jgi:hypothetical protein
LYKLSQIIELHVEHFDDLHASSPAYFALFSNKLIQLALGIVSYSGCWGGLFSFMFIFFFKVAVEAFSTAQGYYKYFSQSIEIIISYEKGAHLLEDDLERVDEIHQFTEGVLHYLVSDVLGLECGFFVED